MQFYTYLWLREEAAKRRTQTSEGKKNLSLAGKRGAAARWNS